MTAEDWKRRSVYSVGVNSVVLCKYSASTHLEVLSNFTDETLERKLANKELCGLLIAANFTQSNGTRPEAMRLLDTTCGGLWSFESF